LTGQVHEGAAVLPASNGSESVRPCEATQSQGS